ncbi:recombinase family protein [Mucilaginibacter jinjuensis]|uniref:Recombinase family protein n=1 Tax=Mucilaginibacter jinjuensis TaxID=1176721 RepID=A0ABY7TEJ7_9SPHI|nr:recombinase family protein [Mucilaginibacter jinjuensis]WCT14954.1 recombinase family protein [Mucilaginibacter jinjuensis]
MKNADLYVRVSTDEQADKGYSQRDQEERLIKYCESNSIKVRKIIFEDHSAKTFNRPQWAKYLSEIKKQKGRGSDLVLFTKWDRFSRNAGDAYQMIATLRKLEIDPQAIEQPLNMEIPESKIMLAVYLASPEVENDRRALNVKHGMRRARKEGRYMGVAPIGYNNKTRENGTKYIAPNLEEAPFMQWIFAAIADGIFAPDQIRKLANEKGFMISRANFYREIRNPVYCGKIVIKQYKEEKEHLVNGLHEALISEALFYKVQDILQGNKIVMRAQALKIHEALPLQGLMECATCDRQLTGSASKGRSGYYFYYHAQASYGCGCRYKADEINNSIIMELEKFIPRPGMAELYKMVIMDIYKNNRGSIQDERKDLMDKIERLNDKLANARGLLFDGKVEPEDFVIMKKDCEAKIKRLEICLTEIKVQHSSFASLDTMILKAIEALSDLKNLYLKSDVVKKREILGSIFRKKLRFEKSEYRTGDLNEVVTLIFQINNQLGHKKNGKERLLKRLSRPVLRAGIEPARL